MSLRSWIAPLLAVGISAGGIAATTDSPPDEEAAVIAAAEAAWKAYNNYVVSPDDPTVAANLEQHIVDGSAASTNIETTVANFEQLGIEYRLNPEIAPSITVHTVELESDQSPITATLTGCFANSGSVYVPKGVDGNEFDTIAYDSATNIMRQTLTKVDGVWKLSSSSHVTITTDCERRELAQPMSPCDLLQATTTSATLPDSVRCTREDT
jgi:hypothetical protein